MQTHPSLLLFVGLLGASLARGGPPQEPTPVERSVPRLVLERLDGTLLERDALAFSTRDPREHGAWLVRPLGTRPTYERVQGAGRLARVTLAGGDEILGRIAGGEEERLELELLGGVRLPLQIDRLQSVLQPELVPERLLEPLGAPEEGDRLYRRTGGRLDRIDGTIEAFTDDGVRFESLLGTTLFSWDEVAALYVEVLDDEEPAGTAERAPVVLDLVDGSRMRGELVLFDAEGCRISVGGLHEISFPLEEVAELQVADGALVFLSDLPAAAEEGQGVPFGDELGMVWPHRMDRAATGGPLRAGDRGWRRGIGMHAPTRVTWELDGAYATLRGAVAIDSSVLTHGSDARGSVIFRVETDGVEAWRSGVVRGGDPPVQLPVLELADVSQLVLEADPAGDFAGDRANWLRLVLVAE